MRKGSFSATCKAEIHFAAFNVRAEARTLQAEPPRGGENPAPMRPLVILYFLAAFRLVCIHLNTGQSERPQLRFCFSGRLNEFLELAFL